MVKGLQLRTEFKLPYLQLHLSKILTQREFYKRKDVEHPVQSAITLLIGIVTLNTSLCLSYFFFALIFLHLIL